MDIKRSLQLKNAVNKRRRKLKQLAIDYKGGKCIICGYNKCQRALHFHHINPSEKSFGLSRANKSWKSVKKELDKTILVCANCHMEIEESLYTHRTMSVLMPD